MSRQPPTMEIERRPRKARRKPTIPSPETITATTPLRLHIAAQLAFPDGSMGASGLRREGQRGRLVIERIAGKDFTTLRHIEEMREKCRDPQKAQGFGSNPKSATRAASSSAAQPGSSATDRVRSARAALDKTAKGLSECSQSTSPASTRSPASGTVIPLKSLSSTS
ncbi:MAG: hypothetical protein WB500_07095 [Rhodoplanes sp.]